MSKAMLKLDTHGVFIITFVEAINELCGIKK